MSIQKKILSLICALSMMLTLGATGLAETAPADESVQEEVVSVQGKIEGLSRFSVSIAMAQFSFAKPSVLCQVACLSPAIIKARKCRRRFGANITSNLTNRKLKRNAIQPISARLD